MTLDLSPFTELLGVGQPMALAAVMVFLRIGAALALLPWIFGAAVALAAGCVAMQD